MSERMAEAASWPAWLSASASDKPAFDPAQATKWALGIWRSSIDARHAVLTKRYFRHHVVPEIPDCIDGEVSRFNPRLKVCAGAEDRGAGLVWLLRDVFNDEPAGILRLFLDATGNVIGRRALGRTTYNAAIKLDADEEVAEGLCVATSIEQGLAAMAQVLPELSRELDKAKS
jgi:hypothetical protein